MVRPYSLSPKCQIALLKRKRRLRVRNFPGSGSPIFGTRLAMHSSDRRDVPNLKPGHEKGISGIMISIDFTRNRAQPTRDVQASLALAPTTWVWPEKTVVQWDNDIAALDQLIADESAK